MATWRFRDFLNARRENVIKSWLDSLPKGAKAAINAHIAILEGLDVAVFDRGHGVGQLTRGSCRGLIELIVKYKRVQYRPVGWYGPDRKEVTLLAGAVEKDNELEPSSTCGTAQARKALVERNKGKYSCDHDFS